ncbi:GNAT family N-acetyltransferase [Chryseobacterium sp. SG20098]|uniref:GNAT family N-acetyltransferase n=1 Tax=Chryseobacterium sp. SG20098 TaxID=3074145 RepID=UPI0028834337|nr:GNAT family N-acetyltransferase [Chryseobacterium sp. SG20098]WNI37222.1 GNAT family N-acetyltransferase [Chryseobacterium sp. SG20098]
MKEKWIAYPTILEGETVELIPLEKEHFEELYAAASDKELWELIPTDCSEETQFYKTYEFALSERETGNQYPFVIRHKETGKLIGSTRFFEIYPAEENWKSDGHGSPKSSGEQPSILNANYCSSPSALMY